MPLRAKNTSKTTKLVQVLGQKPRQTCTDNGPLHGQNSGRDSTHSAFYSRTGVLKAAGGAAPLAGGRTGVRSVADSLSWDP